MKHHHCPRCHAEISIGAMACPACGWDIRALDADDGHGHGR
ncbi:zinc-ribbon domain-containing protein [Acidithiobacillus ferrooxidans]|nr:zinc-ribbon domain-containing protein [Acidithiobacillus ferrooxidans]MBU2859225.1 zinc-ribbon domain-containing protein [Acidithiobacillus ferrooxidans]